MVNRRAFFEIFFYNRENRSREMMEAAESVWRAYMKKYGLGLDAGIDGQPTYEEVREISYLASAAIEAVEKQMAEAAAEEEKRKKLQKEAWDLGIFVPVDTATAELEALVMKAMNPQPEEAAKEELAEPVAEVPAEEVAEEPAAEAEEAPVAEVVEEPAAAEPEVAAVPVMAVPVVEVPVQVIPEEKKIVKSVPVMAAPIVKTDALSLWITELTSWCQNKGMQCITTVDEGDVYLHVYFPHKKDVYTVGKWCFASDVGGAVLAAEMTRLFAYCEGFADCFAKLMK
jgi:hypothetical protein